MKYRHSGADVVVDVHFEMTLELVGEVTIASVFEKQSYSETIQPSCSNFSKDG